ncbi:MAG: 2-dehydropantoate 2-reductase [Humibacillus sp.]|nr:2-dehydropantoate 2-reductase [Humibacillus sp.]MDN5778905.1 2-dehydropantoate 2-reductase [Humibacillus sp.]
MRLAVIGTGAIGGYFGGRLAASGHDVTFVARGEHLVALRRDGLRVESYLGDIVIDPASATDDPTGIGAVDVVLVAVKTWQLADVLPMLPSLVGEGTAVLTTQNGVESPDRVAAVVGRDAVLPGVAKIIAWVDGPGRIAHRAGPATLAFAEWTNGSSDRVAALRSALVGAAVESPVPQDIWVELWSKMLFVVPFGELGAALDLPMGQLRSGENTRRLLESAMGEIDGVAQASGVHLPDTVVDDTMAFVDAMPAEATSSLQRDLLGGRPSELDAWTGDVVRLGTALGVDVQLHRLLYEVLKRRHPNALP